MFFHILSELDIELAFIAVEVDKHCPSYLKM